MLPWQKREILPGANGRGRISRSEHLYPPRHVRQNRERLFDWCKQSKSDNWMTDMLRRIRFVVKRRASLRRAVTGSGNAGTS
jgi:hypothetical protein